MVTNPNPRLAAELLAEKSGILNWMLEGARRLDKAGFTYTQDPEEMAKRYIERSEPVVKFLEACCSEDFDGFVESKRVYAAYNAWAKANKKKRMGGREFINAMRNQSIYSMEYTKQYTTGDYGNRPWGFSGIKLEMDAKKIETEYLPTDS